MNSDPGSAARRSRVPWALAVTVGLCSGLAGYVIHAARVNRIPKQVVAVKRLTDMPGAEESPAISPDGKSVAFVAVSGGRRQIWAGAAAITHDDGDHYGPRWSADSSRLIYWVSYLGSNAIWEIPAAGGEARRLAGAEAPGDLSHAGKRLAFLRSQTTGVELVVDERVVARLNHATYSNLRWSPDDKKIAYVQDGNVMVVSASGGVPVVAAKGGVQGFTWTPDSAGMIISTHGELWFVPRKEGGSHSQLTFGELSYESPDIGPGGSLVVSRRGQNATDEADIIMFTGLKW